MYVDGEILKINVCGAGAPFEHMCTIISTCSIIHKTFPMLCWCSINCTNTAHSFRNISSYWDTPLMDHLGLCIHIHMHK